MAIFIISALVSASNLDSSRFRYHLMVSGLRESSSAIWGEVKPRATRLRISCSRLLNVHLVLFIVANITFIKVKNTTLKGGNSPR